MTKFLVVLLFLIHVVGYIFFPNEIYLFSQQLLMPKFLIGMDTIYTSLGIVILIFLARVKKVQYPFSVFLKGMAILYFFGAIITLMLSPVPEGTYLPFTKNITRFAVFEVIIYFIMTGLCILASIYLEKKSRVIAPRSIFGEIKLD